MFPIFGILFRAALLVGGLWWCKEVFDRWHRDIADFRATTEPLHKFAIIFIWLVTIFIAFLIGRFVLGLVLHAARYGG